MARSLLGQGDMWMKALGLLACLPLAACTVGDQSPSMGSGVDEGSGSDTGSTGPGSGSNPNAATMISGNITESATWSGTVGITAAATIAAGVTITVSPGAAIAGPGTLTIDGTLAVGGTKGATVAFQGVQLYVDAGGSLNLAYAVATGAGIRTQGGTTVVTDSIMNNASGDLFTMHGGSVNVSYSNFGVPAGMADTTHCQTHFDETDAGETPNTISITYSNISTPSDSTPDATYGTMFYGGDPAVFTNNNWLGGGSPIEQGVSGVVGDFSSGYFPGGKPVGTPGLTFNTLSATPLTGVGPR